MAQRTASTALANSTSAPSPVVLTMRPRCSAILGSIEFAAARFERCESAFLVNAHQAAVAGDIGRENGGQPPFYPRLGHSDRPACYFTADFMGEGGVRCLSRARCRHRVNRVV